MSKNHTTKQILLKTALASSIAFGTLAAPLASFASDDSLTAMQKFDYLKQANIFEGRANGDAALDAYMTRAEMATILFRLMKLKPDTSASSFADSTTHWVQTQGYLEAVRKAGLMNGKAANVFDPDGQITIQEMATVMVRALGLQPETGDVSGKVDDWAKGYVKAAVDAGILPAQSDYSVPALRNLLVSGTYFTYQKMNNLSVVSATAVDLRTVNVTFNDGSTKVITLDKDLVPNVATTISVNDLGETFPIAVTLSVSPKIVSAEGVSNTTVDVMLSDSILVATPSMFTVKDDNGNTLEVVSAQLKDAKTVRLTTASQSVASLYTVSSGDTSAKFVGQAVDTTKPVVSSATSTSNTQVSIVFNKTLDKDTAENIANYSINNLSILKAELQSDNKTVKLTTTPQTQGIVYTVAAIAVNDVSGNQVDTLHNSYMFAGTPVDLTQPKVSSAIALSNTSVQVTFDKTLEQGSAETAANYSINGLTVSKAELQSDNKTVVLTTSPQMQGTVYTILAQNVKDVSGNNVNGNADSYQFGGVPADTVSPQVTSAASSGNSSVMVLFNEGLNKATAENIANYQILGLNVLKAELQSDNKTVKLTTTPQTQGTIYTVTATNVQDTSGNIVDAAKDSYQFGGIPADTIAPRVLRATSTGANMVRVVFNEPVDNATATEPFNYYLGVSLGYATNVTKDTTITDGTVWNITTKTQDAVVYNLVVSGVKDLSGNLVDTSYNSSTFGGYAGQIDTTAPELSAAVALNENTIALTFNEAIDPATFNINNVSVVVSNGTDASASPIVGKIASGYTISADNRTVTLEYTPNTTMTDGTIYAVTVTGVKDQSGNMISSTANSKLMAANAAANVSPKVNSAYALNNQTITLAFNEPISTSTLGTGDFSFSPSFTGVLNKADLSSDKKSLTLYYKSNNTPLSTDILQAGTIYTLTLAGKAKITDAFGVTGYDSTTGSDQIQFGGVSNSTYAPKVASVKAVDEDTVDIFFDQKVDATSLSTSDIAVTNQDSSPLNAAVKGIQVQGTNGNQVRVFFASGTFQIGKLYNVIISSSSLSHVQNFNGQSLDGSYNYQTFASVSTANPVPKLTSAQDISTSLVKKFRVTFSEAVSNVDATDFVVNGGAVTVQSVAPYGTDGKTFDVTVNNLTSSTIYTVGLSNATDVQDQFGTASVDKTVTTSFVGK